MKFSFFALLSIILYSNSGKLTLTLNTEFDRYKKKDSSSKSKNNSDKSTISTNNHTKIDKYRPTQNFKLDSGPIFAKGWLKYTTFNKKDQNKPQEFYKNKDFYEQMSDGKAKDLSKKDKVGYINIPNEDYFFFILTENSLNVLSSRKVLKILI